MLELELSFQADRTTLMMIRRKSDLYLYRWAVIDCEHLRSVNSQYIQYHSIVVTLNKL